MKSLRSFIEESRTQTARGCIFCVGFLGNDPEISVIKENSEDIYKDIQEIFEELSESRPEYRLKAPNHGSRSSVFGISYDSDIFIKCSWEFSSFSGYEAKVRPAPRSNLKFVKGFPESARIISNFSYKGSVPELDLALYTYSPLTSETYVDKPVNKWGDRNGILVSRSKAGVSVGNYRYSVDLSSIDPNYLVELFPDMKYSMSNDAVNGTFIYLKDSFKVNLNSRIKLDK